MDVRGAPLVLRLPTSGPLRPNLGADGLQSRCGYGVISFVFFLLVNCCWLFGVAPLPESSPLESLPCIHISSEGTHATRMPLQLPPSVFNYSRLCRLLLDLVVVLALLGSMLYVALDGNTWAYPPLRVVPTLVGCSLFSVSLLLSDRVYQIYREWLTGWPS